MNLRLWYSSICLLLAFCYSQYSRVHAFDRNNVSLKNWGGFSVNHSWIYDALDKIALAGLVDKVLLNTKPLSRLEAARIVARAVRTVREDRTGEYNHRDNLQEVLYRLVKEFGLELAEMGIKTSLNRNEAPRFFQTKLVDHAQVSSVFASESNETINNFGKNISDGRNFSTTMDGRIQIGDFLSFYYQPEFIWNKDKTNGQLVSGYGKLSFWNIEVLAGKDSIWWGPGYNGASLISNNAPPMPMVKLSSAEPFRFPWLLRHLGPTKVVTFVGQLEEDRRFPNAKLGGFRGSIAPTRWLELGVSWLYQFGGDGRPSPRFSDIPTILTGSGDVASRGGGLGGTQDRLNNNGLFAYDVTVRIPNISRFLPFSLADDLEMYLDYGSDDVGFRFGIPLPDVEEIALVAGIYLPNLFRWTKTDLRFEVGRFSDETYVHSIYLDGLTFEGRTIGHHAGTDSQSVYLRLTRWLNEDFFLGIDLQGIRRGIEQQSNRETRVQFGVDLSYRGFKKISTFIRYQFERIENVDFRPNVSNNNHFLQLDATYQF